MNLERLAWRGRYVNVTFKLSVGDVDYLVSVRDGQIDSIDAGPHVMPRWTFALVGDADAWQRFWSPTPEPRFHDLLAMVKFKRLRIDGDQAIFMSNLLYFKDLVQHLGGRLHAR